MIRDSLFYLINLVVFYLFLFKNNYLFLLWYDSFISISVYVVFIFINLFDKQIFHMVKKFSCRKKSNTDEINYNDIELVENLNPVQGENAIKNETMNAREPSIRSDYDEPYDFFNSFKRFKVLPFWRKIKLILVIPAHAFAFITILDFRRFEKYKNAMLFVTIILSLFLISLCSYILVWMSLVVCDTMKISETLFGFVILSAATSAEETITSVSICRREIKRIKDNNDDECKLNMALSNAIGSSIFDTSIGLGLPYLLNSLFFSHGRYFTKVYSGNIAFMLFGLIICLALYLILLKFFNWKLTRCFGISLTFIWIIYTVLVICLEMNLIKFDFFNFYFKKCK